MLQLNKICKKKHTKGLPKLHSCTVYWSWR